MDQILVPLVVALSGLPALAIAAWTGGGGGPHARGAGLRWALIALAIFCGAIGLYWAGDSRPRTYAVVVAMLIAVNAAAVSLVLHLRRGAGPR